MARRSTTNSADINENTATVDENAVADKSVEKGIDETNKDVDDENKGESKTNIRPLEDLDEIEVVSLVPNVSYKDSRTNDIFEWIEIGHIEYMTVETLKNMWRNHKGYFKNMLLKPNDERVITKFGLKSTYENYEFLMDGSNYNRQNISLICKKISDTPNGLKYTIINKVKNLIMSGDVADINVIRALERHLNLDLTSFLE